MKKLSVKSISDKLTNKTIPSLWLKLIWNKSRKNIGPIFGLTLMIIAGCQTLNESSSLQSTYPGASQSNLPISQFEVKPGDITIMSYNVENLFDTQHDAGKKDWEYLPLSEKSKPEIIKGCEESSRKSFQIRNCLESDWNENILNKKMQQIGNVFKQVKSKSANGEILIGPDIATLMEVENISVLKKFINTQLPNSKYQTIILIEGEDRRGIDVAVVSRFPLAGDAHLKLIDFSEKTLQSSKFENADSSHKKPLTRGLLQVPLKLPNGTVGYIIALHFPSQMNPVQERFDSINTLKTMRTNLPLNSLVIAAGDTNITPEEEQEHKIFSDLQNSIWSISHFVGCKQCDGTHNYKGNWSFLDAFFISKSLEPDAKTNLTTYKYLPESIYTITSAPDQVTKGGRPKRFDQEKETGYSDHLPIVITLRQR